MKIYKLHNNTLKEALEWALKDYIKDYISIDFHEEWKVDTIKSRILEDENTYSCNLRINNTRIRSLPLLPIKIEMETQLEELKEKLMILNEIVYNYNEHEWIQEDLPTTCD